MNFSRHKEKFPPEMAAYFSCSWDKRELWRLELPQFSVPIHEVEWHLDYPFWSSSPPVPLFDLRPRVLLESPNQFPKRWERVHAADLKFPIEVGLFGKRQVILDGLHRLLKSVVIGAAVMECRLVPRGRIRAAA
jgi:hypothetical protein